MSDYQNGYSNPQGNNPQGSNPQGNSENSQPPPGYYNPPHYNPAMGMDPPEGYEQKSRIAAGFFAVFMGAAGIHHFYLGNTSKGLTSLLISLLTFGIGAIIMAVLGIREGLKIFDGRINTDAYGIYLKH